MKIWNILLFKENLKHFKVVGVSTKKDLFVFIFNLGFLGNMILKILYDIHPSNYTYFFLVQIAFNFYWSSTKFSVVFTEIHF